MQQNLSRAAGDVSSPSFSDEFFGVGRKLRTNRVAMAIFVTGVLFFVAYFLYALPGEAFFSGSLVSYEQILTLFFYPIHFVGVLFSVLLNNFQESFFTNALLLIKTPISLALLFFFNYFLVTFATVILKRNKRASFQGGMILIGIFCISFGLSWVILFIESYIKSLLVV